MHSMTVRLWRVGLCFYLAVPVALLAHGLTADVQYSAHYVFIGAMLAAFAVASAFLHSMGFRKIENPRAWQSGWALPAATTAVFVAIYQFA